MTTAAQKEIKSAEQAYEAAFAWIESDQDFEDAANHIVATAKIPISWRWSTFGDGIEFFVPQ